MNASGDIPGRAVILVLVLSTAGILLVSAKVQVVSAILGSDVHLPCLFALDAVPDLSLLTVHWAKDGNVKATFEKMVLRTARSRLQLNMKDLEKGNASLVIRSVNIIDVGNYVCSITYHKMKRTIITQLKIKGANPRNIDTVQELVSQSGEDVVLWCAFKLTPPTTDRSQVDSHWLMEDNKAPYEGTSRHGLYLTGDEKPIWNATLVLEQVTPANTGLYRCIISYQDKQQETCQVLLKIEDSAPSDLKPPPEFRSHHILVPAVKPEEQTHRYLKVGMVLGVLATACGLAIVLMVCFAG